MLILDRKRLEDAARRRGFTLNGLAREAGISRQSIYNMFRGRYLLSTPLEKLLRVLEANFSDLATSTGAGNDMILAAPVGIRNACSILKDYAAREGADLFLIGSRARGRRGFRVDWDFAIYFPDGRSHPEFAALKFKASDAAFPHRIDLVCLNFAPPWFIASVRGGAVRVFGETDFASIFTGEAELRKGRNRNEGRGPKVRG